MRVLMKKSSIRFVKYEDLNSYGTLFGGTLISWMDELAAILAIQHTCRECVTVSFKNIEFFLPAKLGDILRLEAEITQVHNTSMDIIIEVYKMNHKEKEI